MFVENGEAESFVKHFGGNLAVEGHPFAGAGNPRPNVWAQRQVRSRKPKAFTPTG